MFIEIWVIVWVILICCGLYDDANRGQSDQS
jgi:hypothetical protein